MNSIEAKCSDNDSIGEKVAQPAADQKDTDEETKKCSGGNDDSSGSTRSDDGQIIQHETENARAKEGWLWCGKGQGCECGDST